MNKKIITINQNYNVSIETLWQCITDRALLKKWYFTFGEDWQMKVGAKFSWNAQDGECNNWLHTGEMLEISEPNMLKHSWYYPGFSGYSIVYWQLIKIDDENTALHFIHEFVESFDASVKALEIENFQNGWNIIINKNLMAFLKEDR